MSNTFGTLSSAPNNKIITTIYRYLATVLKDFKVKKDENENAITNRLCKILSAKKPAEYSFYFHHQNLENDKENTSTDFAVFSTYAFEIEKNIANQDEHPLIKCEAKRLNSSLPKKRRKEYVCGEYDGNNRINNSGGIERFKNGRHGKDVINACMIGYIQSDSAKYWYGKINEWIKEEIKNASDTQLIWSNNDLLIQINQSGQLCEFSSSSKRIYGDEINFRHFWIESLK